jgi:hypothetical protein
VQVAGHHQTVRKGLYEASSSFGKLGQGNIGGGFLNSEYARWDDPINDAPNDPGNKLLGYVAGSGVSLPRFRDECGPGC